MCISDILVSCATGGGEPPPERPPATPRRWDAPQTSRGGKDRVGGASQAHCPPGARLRVAEGQRLLARRRRAPPGQSGRSGAASCPRRAGRPTASPAAQDRRSNVSALAPRTAEEAMPATAYTPGVEAQWRIAEIVPLAAQLRGTRPRGHRSPPKHAAGAARGRRLHNAISPHTKNPRRHRPALYLAPATVDDLREAVTAPRRDVRSSVSARRCRAE